MCGVGYPEYLLLLTKFTDLRPFCDWRSPSVVFAAESRGQFVHAKPNQVNPLRSWNDSPHGQEQPIGIRRPEKHFRHVPLFLKRAGRPIGGIERGEVKELLDDPGP